MFQLLRGQRRDGSHAQRLESFYAPQAGSYDAFREKLLHGRESLVARLAPPPNSRVVELGCGTGRNIEFFGDRVGTFASVDLVDVCAPLLDQAQRRAARWPSVVRVVEADAERYRPAHPVDCVYLSYSLSMTANWRKTICNAVRMLQPGGTLGVVDFFVSGSAPQAGEARHSWISRQFWPRWFAHDGVHLTPEHLRALADCTDTIHLEQHLAPVPWLPLLRVPYYIYIGRKRRI
jgi:S-adenosylmethionine-diacylgycerolhomoserine-N-methlytransferase